ncbi:hypothetical protein VZT92_024595 [Zoarces viviparus]|uniref:Uncharacterized protein n=1 Tax=Zoarces viviparus TaxID=48416 RepID=A0AAW1E2E1_ZOAVI
MSASPCLFRRHKQLSVSHRGTNTRVAKESPHLRFLSASPLSLKSTSAWIPDPPRRDLVSGQYLQSPLEAQQSSAAGG